MSGSIPLRSIYAFKVCTTINLPVSKSGEIDQRILSSGTGSFVHSNPGKRLSNWILRGFRSLSGRVGQESNPGYPAMNIMTELSSLQSTLMENTKYWSYSIKEKALSKTPDRWR
jgi:hypothetical protein